MNEDEKSLNIDLEKMKLGEVDVDLFPHRMLVGPLAYKLQLGAVGQHVKFSDDEGDRVYVVTTVVDDVLVTFTVAFKTIQNARTRVSVRDWLTFTTPSGVSYTTAFEGHHVESILTYFPGDEVVAEWCRIATCVATRDTKTYLDNVERFNAVTGYSVEVVELPLPSGGVVRAWPLLSTALVGNSVNEGPYVVSVANGVNYDAPEVKTAADALVVHKAIKLSIIRFARLKHVDFVEVMKTQSNCVYVDADYALIKVDHRRIAVVANADGVPVMIDNGRTFRELKKGSARELRWRTRSLSREARRRWRTVNQLSDA